MACCLGSLARADGGDLMALQPIQGEFNAVGTLIASVVIRRRNNIDASQRQRSDHFRLGLEDHAVLDQMPFIRKRRFQIYERDIGSLQYRSQVAQRKRRIVLCARQAADVAREHYVAAQDQTSDYRTGRTLLSSP